MTRKWTLYQLIIIVLFVASAAFAVHAHISATSNRNVEIPPFESSVETGEPDVDPSLEYAQVNGDGMPYTFHVCGVFTVDNDLHKATVYFANDEDNDVLLKLEAYDDAGSLVGETGLVKPGEYVESVSLDTAFDNGDNVELRVVGYEPDTYYSAGNVTLRTIVSTGA